MQNKFLDAMMFRHACKEFDATKKISDDEFNTILEIGRLSPSSFGFEPWKFVIVQNEALRAKLKEFTWGAQGQLPTASHFMIILSRKSKGMRYDSEYIKYMMKDVKHLPQDVIEMYSEFYEKFQKVDFNLLESDRALFDWATKQTYIALANMMSGAASMGIDSCPIEGFDYNLTEEFVANELNIDTQEFGVAVMVAFGYRKDEPKREKERQEMSAVTTWFN
jgi:nitroreductase